MLDFRFLARYIPKHIWAIFSVTVIAGDLKFWGSTLLLGAGRMAKQLWHSFKDDPAAIFQKSEKFRKFSIFRGGDQFPD